MWDRLKAVGRMIDNALTSLGTIIYYGFTFVAVLVVVIFAISLIERTMYLRALLWLIGGLLLLVALFL